MSPVPRRALLEALDETPRTVTGLSRVLEQDEETVEEALREAEAEGLAVDWGELWATTWRAKLKLAPRFFRIWIPASLALGTALTALAVALNAASAPTWLVPLLVALSVLAGLAALAPIGFEPGEAAG